MPNWCSNFLTVESDQAAAIATEFERLARQEKAENCGQLLFNSGESYLFEIALAEEDGEASGDSVSVLYETRWSPNAKDMLAIARTRGFDFSLEYEELGNLVFGEVQFTAASNLLRERFLTWEDFDRVQETEDGRYLLDGLEYECSSEAYEDILKSKHFEIICHSA
ncbi:MAG TPA: hypothetical protein VK308_05965 [Pyrinomonadaceae bacterium]|nr:hypothetical protein [Pyrinomonadaceae bacterium]